MPYRTSNNYRPRRRRSTRRRNMPSAAPTYGQIFNKVVKDVSTLKSLVNVEFKEQTFTSTTAPTAAGVIHFLNQIAQGDAASTRDGLQCRFKSLEHRSTYTLHASATASIVRLIFFIEKDVDLAAPVPGDVLENVSSGDISIVSERNLDNRKNLIILKEFNFVLTTEHPIKIIKWYKKLDMITIYTGAAATQANLSSNGLYFVAFTQEATNVPATIHRTRVRWVDN